MEDDDFELDVETITLTDDTGRTINCTIEHAFEVEGKDYVLLLPVDFPVEIIAWKGDEEDEEAIPVEDEQEIEQIFPIAKAVLEEQNLVLKRTAVTLTVEGELPELAEEAEFLEVGVETNGAGEEAEEELQFLASFYSEEQEYGVYAPLDPFLILARIDERQQPQLLSEAELTAIEPLLPMIEEQLLEQFE